ncbi:MAG: tetratricopeptide repeat protein, partial [bacterium]
GDCCLILGVVRHSVGDFEEADSNFRRSLKIREDLRDLVGIASALNNLGNLSSDRGRYGEADECYRRSFELRAKIGHMEGMSAALVNRGNVAFNGGRYEDARQHYDEALALAERIGSAYTAAFARLNLARTLYRMGETGGAMELLLTVQGDAARRGFQDLQCAASAVLAVVCLAQRNLVAAEVRARESLEMARAMDSKFYRALALRALGQVLTAKGDRESGVAALLESLNLFEEMKAEHEAAKTCAELSKAESDWDKANAYRNRAQAVFERLGAMGDLGRLGAKPD